MGRNAASSVHWTCIHDGTNFSFVWYCQQHAKWDSITSSSYGTAFASLKTHLESVHGNVEQ